MAKTISHIKRSLDLDQRVRIDRLALHFEDAWKSGKSPRVERYLAAKQCDANIRAALLEELLALEIEYRVRGGERPLLADYQQRFPDDVTLVATVFQDVCPSLLEAPSPSESPSDAAHNGMAGEPSTDVSESDAAGTSGASEADAPPDIPLPEGLSRYRILREIGEGGFGRVLLAEDLTLGTLAAIKISRRGLFVREQDVSRFLREARTAAPLKYDNIARVYDVGRDGDLGCYIVMDYIDGGSLDVQEAASRMSLQERALLIAKVARAIHRVHHNDELVHRDLKPDNILLDSQGTPYVVDFGMALHEQQQRKRSGEFAGTLAYMSPEQVRGETQFLDGRTDIWSLGVVLYELLTLRRPFAGETEERLSDEILHRDPRPPRQVNDVIPSELEQVCLRALKRQPHDRFPTALDFAEALEAAVPDEVVAHALAAPPRQTPPPPRQQPLSQEQPRPVPIDQPATRFPAVSNLRWAMIGSAAGLLLIIGVLGVTYLPGLFSGKTSKSTEVASTSPDSDSESGAKGSIAAKSRNEPGSGAAKSEEQPKTDSSEQRSPEYAFERVAELSSMHSEPFTRLALSQPAVSSSQPTVVAAGDRMGYVCVWDWQTGSPVHLYDGPDSDSVADLCLSRDGRLLVVRWTGNDDLYVYDLVKDAPLDGLKVTGAPAWLAAADDPSCVWLVERSGAKIVCRDVETGDAFPTLQSARRQYPQIAVSNGQLAVAGYDTVSRQWGVKIEAWGIELSDVGPVRSVALAAKAQRSAIVSFNASVGVRVQLEHKRDLVPLNDPAGQPQRDHRIAFSDDGSLLVDICHPPPGGVAEELSGLLRLWNLNTDPPALVLKQSVENTLTAVAIDYPRVVLAFDQPPRVEVFELSSN